MRKLMLIMGLIFCMTLPTFAQDNPPEIDVALQSLSLALGVDVTIDNLENITWREVTFASTALGCPNPAQVYAPLDNATGYQIFLAFNGVTYDYRVTQGGEFVSLCSVADSTLIAPLDPVPVVPIEPTPVIIDTNDNTCPNALLPRLTVRDTARTTPELGSNIRSLPDLDAEDIGTIPPSTQFVVLGGPECGADGNFWWQIDYNGINGWTVQGQNGLYYVEPIPQPLLTTSTTISSVTADDLLLLSEIESNLLGVSAWSPDGEIIAIADASTANPAIWLYFVNNLSQVPVLVEVSFDTSAMAFSPDGSLLVVGDPSGNIYMIELNTYTVVSSFVAHDTAVLDLDFSPDGRYLLVVDDNYTARIYGVVTP